METSPVTLRLEGAIAIVAIDHPPVNALSHAVRQGLLAAFDTVAADDAVSAVVLSGGSMRFIAGADIKEMARAPREPYLPEVIAAIAACLKPVVAAIDGAALGGGLEVALACDRRIGSPKAVLGLPETRLGIVPGAGGTQRLPRLVGVARAIEMIAGARLLEAKEAEEAGLLDAIVEGDVLEAAIEAASRSVKRPVSGLPLPKSDEDAEDAAAAFALRRAKGLPAIGEAVRLVRGVRSTPFEAGLDDERVTFLRLRDSEEAMSLRHLFFAEREASKVPGLEGATARPLDRVAVIGAGTMGVGIAAVLADARLPVVLIEKDEDAARVGETRVRDLYDAQVAAGRLSGAEAHSRIARIKAGADWSALAHADLVIEAAFEDMGVKEDIFRRLDAKANPGAVLATNTSYLDIDRIAGATGRPQDVVGLHFFAPANVMKLLEIVRTSRTHADVLMTALALAKRIRKQPVVAGNCDGFIGNRIYAVYRRHAEYLLEDGASLYEIDAALEAYGFALGIFAVSDLSGLDISYAMRRRRDATRDPAERYVAIADRLVDGGRLGRKSGSGWYNYASRRPEPDPMVERIVAAERQAKGILPRKASIDAIQRRLLAVMANEGAKILEEGIALRASDIDLVFVNGYGFPRGKGGPMWAADRSGLRHVLAEVQEAYTVGGAGSEPAALLIELARRGATFCGQAA